MTMKIMHCTTFGLWLALAICLMASPVTADSTWTVYDALNSPLPSNLVGSIYFDGFGKQYIGTSGGGLVVRDDSVWTIWNSINTGAPIDVTRLIVREYSGNLWIAATSGNLDMAPFGFGVAHFTGADSAWNMFNQGLEISQIVTGIVVTDSFRYVSTFGGGLTVYNSQGWIRYRYSSRSEYSYADSQQHVYNVAPGTYLPSDYIRCMEFEQQNNRVWMATADGGLVLYDQTNWVKYNNSNSGLPSNQLLSIKFDHSGDRVLIGTAGSGLAIFGPNNNWTIYNTANSPLADGMIYSIEVRPANGEIWLGTGYGVWVKSSDDSWRSYMAPTDNFIAGEFYSDIAFDSSNAVWVAAYDAGIARLGLDTVPSPPPPPSDTLDITIEHLRLLFYRNRPVERISTEIEILNAPTLSSDDTIGFYLTSPLGEIYSVAHLFGDFENQQGGDHDRDNFRYRQGRLTFDLGISLSDSSDVALSLIDMKAQMNRQNFQNEAMLTIRLGNRLGYHPVRLAIGQSLQDDELNPDGDTDIDIFEYVEETTDMVESPVRPEETGMGNYPNPFNGQTSIHFALPSDDEVMLDVYDILGRRVSRIFAGHLDAGEHNFIWPPNNIGTRDYHSGVYYYRLVTGYLTVTGKMLYLK